MVNPPLTPQGDRSTTFAGFERDRPLRGGAAVPIDNLVLSFSVLSFISHLLVHPLEAPRRLCQAYWHNSVTTNISQIRRPVPHHEYRAPSVWKVEEEGRRPSKCHHAPQRV